MIRTMLKYLMKPEAYPEPTGRVELIQTHVSCIFLTDRYAYKVKKPVDFGFLNFSTIDRRRFYCNEEVRLNRRLCPDMYEGVVEIHETPTGAAFYGTGKTLDYAVKMKRLPADRMLDRLIESDSVSEAEMKQIARVIACFHRDAATSETIAEYGHIERIMFNWQENFDQVVAFEDTTLPAHDRELIRSYIFSIAGNNRQLFEQRVSDGFIRECDGDIHLENICLHNGAVLIFDCIEFNERFRFSDTAADIAFLLMDLDFHGRHELADHVITEYVNASGDTGVTALIDFYKIYRACVRGKVESIRMTDSGIDPVARELAGIRASRYFRLACGYIARLHLKPTLFITCGLMGVGKSTLAQQLCFELGIGLYGSDSTRKGLEGITEHQPVRNAFGDGLYNREMTDFTYTELLRLAGDELARGRSAVLDASFIRREYRDRFAHLARQAAVPFVILNISCSDTENRRRLAQREQTGASVSDGRLELLAPQSTHFEPPDDGEGTLITFSASESPTAMARAIYKRLDLPC